MSVKSQNSMPLMLGTTTYCLPPILAVPKAWASRNSLVRPSGS